MHAAQLAIKRSDSPVKILRTKLVMIARHFTILCISDLHLVLKIPTSFVWRILPISVVSPTKMWHV